MTGPVTNEDDIIKLSHKFDNINHIETGAFPVPEKLMCRIFEILISILRIVNNFHQVFEFYISFLS